MADKSGGDLAFWQRFSRLYGPLMGRSAKLYDGVCARIRPRLSREMNVLELACGTGQLSFPLSSRVRLWEATDFSPNMIREAQKRPGSCRLRFSVQDATCLPYGDETFDAVVIANALHIMPHPELALAEIRRVLKPGGLLFAPTFVHGEGRGLCAQLMKLSKLAGFRAYHRWDAAGLAAYVAGHGFRITDRPLLDGFPAPLCCLAAQRL
ncbi:MAG: class I SAM-dependent methyltransferase [Oscillospiraceae bacterium]|nr:class I SAM-dependent methyltransferase [Oscillospiraceae bacterium]